MKSVGLKKGYIQAIRKSSSNIKNTQDTESINPTAIDKQSVELNWQMLFMLNQNRKIISLE